MKYTAIYLLLIISLLGCQKARDHMNEEFKPEARGEASEIILIMDSTQWSGKLGDQLKDMFRAPMPGLPQPEPSFNVSKVNPLKINSVFKSSSKMIFVMTLDSRTTQSKRIRQYFTDNSLKMISGDSSLFMAIHKDEFAKGQIVLYLFAQTEEDLIEKLKQNEKQLVTIFENAAIQDTKNKIYRKKERELMASLKESFGFEIDIPFGWQQAKKTKDFVWLRLLEAESELDVFIHSRPYTDQAVFEDIADFRDEITEKYLRDSEKEDLYITRQAQDFIPFETRQVNFNNNYAVEARGLWKISDNSGGGPFISYTILDEESQKVYYIEGYVYSPGTSKKDLVRVVNAILSTFKVPSQVEAIAS